MTAPAPLSGGDARTQLAEVRELFGERLHRLAHGQVKNLRAPWRWQDMPEEFREAYRQQADEYLLPVVERIADERAAEALERVAAVVHAVHRNLGPKTDLWAVANGIERDAAALRAASSRGEPGPAEHLRGLPGASREVGR